MRERCTGCIFDSRWTGNGQIQDQALVRNRAEAAAMPAISATAILINRFDSAQLSPRSM